MNALIPDVKREAVERALREAFGVSDVEDAQRLTGGLSSALVLRIVIRGRPYVLRLILRDDAFGDPTQQFSNMKVAAEAGIAPRVVYTSVADRLSIIDFIEKKPWPADAGMRIAETIRRLHALPPFPRARAGSYFEALEGFIRKRKGSVALEELFQLYAEVAKVYPRGEQEHVASHNDLKPENLCFDGARVWFIDWEAAFLNDRYLDLAVVANFFVRDDAQEELFLQAYFGEPAGAYRRARFFLMRQMTSVFYATLLGANGRPEPATFPEFHDRLLAGSIDMMTNEARVAYANVHLAEALRSMKSPRFREALSVV